jgi:hypothetical protein
MKNVGNIPPTPLYGVNFLGDVSTEGGVDKTEILTYSHEGSLTIRRW